MIDSQRGNVIYLQPWTELTGTLYSISDDKHDIYFTISRWVLSYPKGSNEGEVLRQQLSKHLGAKVGILRTDLPDKPLLVRIIK